MSLAQLAAGSVDERDEQRRHSCLVCHSGPIADTISIDGRSTYVGEELRRWHEDFEAAARRPLKLRMRYAFIRTYKPVLDDTSYRSFDTTAAYRAWCEAHLPRWLGYGRTV